MAIIVDLKELTDFNPKKYDAYIDTFEDNIQVLKLAEQIQLTELENLIKENINNAENYNTIRKTLNLCILKNEPSADFMITVARMMIATEKEMIRFEPENWPALLYL